jgi:hypothetical protein
MNTILEQITAYFETHSQEEILKDWKSLDKYSNVGMPASEFLEVINQVNSIDELIFRWQREQNMKNKIESPAFMLDFSFIFAQKINNTNYEQSCVFS